MGADVVKSLLAGLFLLALPYAAQSAEVGRYRIYESSYQAGVIVALLADAAVDAYRSNEVGSGVQVDLRSLQASLCWSPFRLEYSYNVALGRVFAHKTTIVTSHRIWQSAHITGDIGELSSAYWCSDAIEHSEGTTIRNELHVTWYPKARCRLVRRVVNRIAQNRVIPPMVDDALAQIESRVVSFARGGRLWAVLEVVQGGLND